MILSNLSHKNPAHFICSPILNLNVMAEDFLHDPWTLRVVEECAVPNISERLLE
jgi:hypothetical protein